MSQNAGIGGNETHNYNYNNDIYKVIVAENVSISDEGEYFVKGMIINGAEQRLKDMNEDLLFIGDKEKMAERKLLITDSLVKSNEGYIWAKICMLEGGNKSIHTGTTLGCVEIIQAQTGSKQSINSLTEKEMNNEKSLINNILKELREKMNKENSYENVKSTMAILERNADIFSKYKMDIGKTELVYHHIETTDNKPIAFKPRRIPKGLEDEVDHMIDNLIEAGIVKPSTSPWNFPIVVVRKKNGDNRMCVDYRALNAKTNRPIFPIPSAEEIFDSVGGARYFSSLDLSSGYYQVPIAEEDRGKTAFSTKYGQYEFTRMPFGLCSAPATFQRLMNIVLRNENWKKCVIYLDDVLIFGKTVEEHNERLDLVLRRIKEAGLKLSPEKCTFLQKEVKYLGHVVTPDGVATDPDKIASIKNWKIPGCKKELQTFLGFCNYYRRFIKEYAVISEPLSSMLRKDKKFVWTEDNRKCFYELREKLMNPPILALPINDGKYILDTDASHNAIGAVLSQIQNGEERVLYYASKTLSKSQKQYCITRKELLAIYTFVMKFKHYLIGKQFVVRTDHQALKWMLNWDSPNTSQYCIWKAELEVFDMIVEFRKGKEHINADVLSRLQDCEQCMIKHLEPQKKRNVKVYPVESNKETESNYSEKILNNLQNYSNEWQQENDPNIKLILEALKNGHSRIKQTGETNEAQIYWKKKEQLRIRGEQLYLEKDDDYLLIVPKHKREEIIWKYHKLLGHTGSEKTIEVLKREYYWPLLSKDVENIIAKCNPCNHNKYINGRMKTPLQNITGYEPFQIIGIDVTGPFKQTKEGYRYILGVIDYFSKYVSLIPIKTTTSEVICEVLWIHWISKFGIPERIHSDRGSNFTSGLFQEYCRILGIRKTFTSPYYPQSDGLVERLFRTVKPMISAVMEDRCIKDWSSTLPIVEYGIRNTVQKTTKYSPYEILFGRRPKINLWNIVKTNETKSTLEEYVENMKQKITIIHNKVLDNIENHNTKKQDTYNRNRWSKEIQLGDKVMIKCQEHSAFGHRYIGPFIVKRIIDKWTYILQNGNDTLQRNYNQIKKIPQDNRSYKSTSEGTSIRTRPKLKQEEEKQSNKRYPVRTTRNPNPKYR